jgi:hypothetical protein
MPGHCPVRDGSPHRCPGCAICLPPCLCLNRRALRRCAVARKDRFHSRLNHLLSRQRKGEKMRKVFLLLTAAAALVVGVAPTGAAPQGGCATAGQATTIGAPYSAPGSAAVAAHCQTPR